MRVWKPRIYQALICRGVDLSNAQLQGALLNGADFQGAQLFDGICRGHNLGALLSFAPIMFILVCAHLQDANLNEAQLQGCLPCRSAVAGG